MAKAPTNTATAAKKPSAKAPSKSEVLNNIAEATGLSRKQVSAVIDALTEEIRKSMGNRGAGVFQIPGLVKITKQKVPARPARKGVPNPFKPGELMDQPARPAYNKIKVRALKNLKDMA
jgi:nucleoid DNA-binding protein